MSAEFSNAIYAVAANAVSLRLVFAVQTIARIGGNAWVISVSARAIGSPKTAAFTRAPRSAAPPRAEEFAQRNTAAATT